uniref:MFS domain-containing protein n=1 Tax=Globodera pallida TaxID=36090 RepID=A0A183CR13_GLOPA
MSSTALAPKCPGTDWPSIYVSTLVAFIGAIHHNSVMVWPFLQLVDPTANETFYGFLRSISGLGTVLTAMVAGYVCNRTANTRSSMIVGKLLALLSCSIYLCIELAPPSVARVHLLFILFELFLGASVGAANMLRTHVAHASTEADRAKAIGVVSLAPAVGLIVGPVINLLSSTIAFPGWPFAFGIHLNLFTAPILLAMLISALALYLLLFHFDGTIRLRHDGIAQNAVNGRRPSRCAVAAATAPSFDWVAVAICLFTRATVSLCLLNLITVGPPYIQMIFRWSSTEMVRYQSYIMGAIGLHGIAWNLAYAFLDMRKRFSERNAIVVSVGLMLFVYLVTFNWPFLSDTIPYQQQQQLNVSNLSSSSFSVAPSAAAEFSFVEAPLGCPQRFRWCETTTLVNMPIFMGSLVLALGVALPVLHINLDILYSKVLGNIRQVDGL